jgi:hypothetical protein
MMVREMRVCEGWWTEAGRGQTTSREARREMRRLGTITSSSYSRTAAISRALRGSEGLVGLGTFDETHAWSYLAVNMTVGKC